MQRIIVQITALADLNGYFLVHLTMFYNITSYDDLLLENKFLGGFKMTKDEEYKKRDSEKIVLIKTWFKGILISAITGTFLYKIIFSPINLSAFDFSDLLSLILAIFSIGLSVMFYIKADETSNRFYDNTQKFTQNVSEILGRIEAGFGERLKHIDEGYNRLEGHYFNASPAINSKHEPEKNKEEIKKENEENKIIEDLIKSSKLDRAEKDTILNKLNDTRKELVRTRNELAHFYNQQSQRHPSSTSRKVLESRVTSYFLHTSLMKQLWKHVDSPDEFQLEFELLSRKENPQWLADLMFLDLLDQSGKLSKKGFNFFWNLLKEAH